MEYQELRDRIEALDYFEGDKLEAVESIQKGIDDFEINEDEYDDYLEGIYGDEVEVCGIKMYPPRVLKECDETSYYISKSDHESTSQSDLQDLLDEKKKN